MGCYLFQNGSVYCRRDGQNGCLSWDEFMASSAPDDKNAHILVAETDGSSCMDRVRQIRQAFSKGKIRTCVAYATALRSFLQMQAFMAGIESCLVVDDLGDRFLLSAFNGRQMPVTRAILVRAPEKIVDEIRRMQKSQPVFRILSNHADVIEALDPERKKDAVFFEVFFPAFEVLGRVKFSSELMSPEEVVMQKKDVIRREWRLAWCLAFVMAATGALCFSYARASARAMALKVDGLMRDKAGLDKKESDLATVTYQEHLKTWPRISFAEVLDRFLTCLPPEIHIEQIALKRGPDMRWHVTGLVSFPRQEILPFACDGVFKGAQVEHVVIQTKPGMRVTLVLPDAKKGPS